MYDLNQSKRFAAILAVFSGLLQATSAAHGSPHYLQFSWNTRRIQGLIVLTAFTPPIIVISIWFWRRRNFHPVKGRMPHVQTLLLVLSSFWVASLGLSDLLHGIAPCIYTYWAISISASVTASIYLLRTWNLYYRHGLTDERLTQFELTLSQSKNRPSWVAAPLFGPKEPAPEKGWFTRHRYLAGNRFVVRYLSIIIALSVGFCSIFTATNSDLYTFQAVECPGDEARWRVLVYFICSCVIALIVMAWKIRHIIDGYWIKEELKATAVVASGCSIVSLLFGMNTTTSDSIGASSLAVSLGVFINAFISGAWPAYRSYRSNEITALRSSRSSLFGQGLSGEDLDDILSDEIARAAFEKFLIAEFAVENLLFYIQAKEYQEVFDERSPEENLRFMDNIYEQFLLPTSMLEINLPGSIKVAIDKQIAAVLKEFPGFRSRASIAPTVQKLSSEADIQPSGLSATVFKTAMESISELLRHDSLPRFLRSNLFREAVKVSTRLRAETNRIVEDTMFRPVASVGSDPTPGATPEPSGTINLSVLDSKTKQPHRARTPSSGYSRRSSAHSSNPGSSSSSMSRPMTFGVTAQLPSMSQVATKPKPQASTNESHLETLQEVNESERLSMSASVHSSTHRLMNPTGKHEPKISDVPEPEADVVQAAKENIENEQAAADPQSVTLIYSRPASSDPLVLETQDSEPEIP